MRRLVHAVGYLPELVAGAMMLAITGILFSGVVWRYVLVDPLPWTDEVARMLFVWLAFLGAAIGVRRGLHASVAILSHRMPRGVRRVSAVFAVLVVAVVAAVLVIVGGKQAIASFSHQAMPVTGISTGWTHIAVPVSGLLMLVYLIPQLRRALRSAVGS